MRMTGIDIYGMPARLGGIDSDGEPIGFIDADGTCYRDETEKWSSRTSGRYLEAWEDWRRAGRPGPPPNLVPFLALVPEPFRLDVLECVSADVEMHEYLRWALGK